MTGINHESDEAGGTPAAEATTSNNLDGDVNGSVVQANTVDQVHAPSTTNTGGTVAADIIGQVAVFNGSITVENGGFHLGR